MNVGSHTGTGVVFQSHCPAWRGSAGLVSLLAVQHERFQCTLSEGSTDLPPLQRDMMIINIKEGLMYAFLFALILLW